MQETGVSLARVTGGRQSIQAEVSLGGLKTGSECSCPERALPCRMQVRLQVASTLSLVSTAALESGCTKASFMDEEMECDPRVPGPKRSEFVPGARFFRAGL